MLTKSAAFIRGYTYVWEKLGYASPTMPSLDGAHQAQEASDAHLPAGELATFLTELPEPVQRKERRGKHLGLSGLRQRDSDVSWSSPESLPWSMATGASPIFGRR